MLLSRLLYLLCVPLFLSSCSQYSGEQTAVTGMCRSCKPYYVRGSWHYPQRFYEYSEEGLASWYGPGFHEKKKASGERFNQHNLNAAHRTLPLPTIVRVTNLENGKTVVVLVDDRGPYTYTGRIIDLSMGAAKVIGCYQNGLARVRVESLVDDSKALSDYLHKHRMGKEHLKRTWQQIYEQEIKGNYLGTPKPLKEKPIFQKVAKKEAVKKEAVKREASEEEASKKANPKSEEKTSKAAGKGDTAPVSKAGSKAGSKVDTKPYVINVKQTFSDKASANTFAKKLESKFPTRVVSEKSAGGTETWRVQAGPFTDESKTDALRKQIKQLTN